MNQQHRPIQHLRRLAAAGVVLFGMVMVSGCQPQTSPRTHEIAAEPTLQPSGDEVVDTSQSGEPSMPLRDSYYACARATEGVTQAIQDCIEEEYGYQDGRLNSVYQGLMKDLPESERNALRDAQRQWLAERDHECSWDAETEGEGQRLDANSCLLRITAERADELAAMKP